MISTEVLWGYLMRTFPLHNKQNGSTCPLTVLLLLLRQWYSIVLVQLHLFWQVLCTQFINWMRINDTPFWIMGSWNKIPLQYRSGNLKQNKNQKFCTVEIFSSHWFCFFWQPDWCSGCSFQGRGLVICLLVHLGVNIWVCYLKILE